MSKKESEEGWRGILGVLANIVTILGFPFAVLGVIATVLGVIFAFPQFRASLSAKPQSSVTPSVVPAVESGLEPTLLLDEDFEDGVAEDMDFQFGNWSIVQDQDDAKNHVLEVAAGAQTPDAVFGSPNWRDYRVEYRFKYSHECGGIFLEFRRSCDPACDYYVQYIEPSDGDAGLSVVQDDGEWVNYGHKYIETEAGEWIWVGVEVLGDQISIFINGSEEFRQSPRMFNSGSLVLSTFPGCRAQFDDIRVTSLSD